MVISGTDLLSSLTPYVHILASSSLTSNAYCSQCFRCSNDPKRCSKCHRISYCSTSCQSQDWIYHKHECSGLSSITDEYDLTRLFLRFILRYKKDQGIQNSSTKRVVDDLQTHESEIRQDRRRSRTFQSIYQRLTQWNVTDSFDEKTLFLLFCRLVINTLTVHEAIDLKPIGYGLYLDASSYNHSCRPTCHTVFNGMYLSIRTISEPTIDGWTINYIDLLDPYEQRQAQLLENYYFRCQCSRCREQNPNELILLEKIRSQEEKMDRFINENDFQRAYQSSEQLCQYYPEVLPYYHAYLSLHHVKHLKLELFLAETLANSVLQTTMKATCQRLQISMGEQHPLTQETVRLCEQYRLETALQQRQLTWKWLFFSLLFSCSR